MVGPRRSRLMDKRPYLEVHHVIQWVDSGPDTPENCVAVCPNCHGRSMRRRTARSSAMCSTAKLLGWKGDGRRGLTYCSPSTDRVSRFSALVVMFARVAEVL